MGAHAETIIGNIDPVFEIVTRREQSIRSDLCKIGYLVVSVAARRRLIEQHLVHLGGEIVVRPLQSARLHLRIEDRPLFYLEKIDGEVFWREFKRSRQIIAPLLLCLVGQAGYQIQTDVVEARASERL